MRLSTIDFEFGCGSPRGVSILCDGAGLKSNLKYRPSIPIPILSHYLATELFVLLKWWLDQGMPYSPERMDEIFHELVNPAFRPGRA
jgi:hypothetical protein